MIQGYYCWSCGLAVTRWSRWV